MRPTDQIRDVTEHCDRTGGAVSRARLAPATIGYFYDSVLSQLSEEDAARRFMNYGYWQTDTTDSQVASKNLMAKLVAGIPTRGGSVLDVACGTGATTHYLSQHWSPERACGINISERQIALCRRHVSGCRFIAMDAAAMTFDDSSFDNVVCVEAAFHFDTREAFLKHAHRVLKKGGALALTDVLLHEEGHALLPMWLRSNFVPSLLAYRELVHAVGFSCVDVIDCTEEGWKSYARHRISKLHGDWLREERTFVDLQSNLREMYRIAAACSFNLICFATK